MTDVKPQGKVAFFYTDGGAAPNPGPAGSGVHGYVFSSPSEKPQILPNHFLTFVNKVDDNAPVPKSTMTIHGYKPCDKDGQVVGRFPWVKPDYYLDIVGSFANYETNNVAELQAVLYAFQAALEVEGLEKLYLGMDSIYAMETISVNADNWARNGWTTSTGGSAANVEIIKPILELRNQLKEKGVSIEYVKVKAHTDDMGNCSADYLSNVGRMWTSAGLVKVDVRWTSGGKKYWENEIERHPMLHGRRFIYNRKTDLNDPNTVFMVEPAGTDLTIGKRDHEAYAVVRLKEPCLAYKALLDAQSCYNQFDNWPMNLKTDRLYNKFVQHWLVPYGAGCMTPHKSGSGLYFLDKGNVAMEHNPPALIYRAVDNFRVLSERLEEFQKLEKDELGDANFIDEDYYGLRALDITDDFYEIIEKKVGKETIAKKQLRAEIVVGYQQHFVDIELELPEGKKIQRKLPVTLGMDMPPRNSLKKLETEDPTVTLITWRSSSLSFQYACIVACDSGIGIWSNFYCDRFFV